MRIPGENVLSPCRGARCRLARLEARNHFAALAGDHEGQDPARRAVREEPDRAVAQEEVAAAAVEAVEGTTLVVAAVDEARPGRNVSRAVNVAIEARAVRPVFAVEPIAPAGPRV